MYSLNLFLLFNFILGGLSAVMWTDFIQTVLMLVGALILMILGMFSHNFLSMTSIMQNRRLNLAWDYRLRLPK